jgi:hypothetical protein
MRANLRAHPGGDATASHACDEVLAALSPYL